MYVLILQLSVFLLYTHVYTINNRKMLRLSTMEMISNRELDIVCTIIQIIVLIEVKIKNSRIFTESNNAAVISNSSNSDRTNNT